MSHLGSVPDSFWFVVAFLAVAKVTIGTIYQLAAGSNYLQQRRVLTVDMPKGQRAKEIRASWHFMSDAVVLVVLTWCGAFSFAHSTLANHALAFIAMYLWVEVWYYFSHRAMHRFDWLYCIHRKHHESIVLKPLSAISMSGTEKWLFYSTAWLGFMALISHWWPVTPIGIAAFYGFNLILSLHGHSNSEPTSVMRLFSRMGFASSTSHALHHARFNVNYCFSLAALDALFGTASSDSACLQANALEGKGARTIRELAKGLQS
jgi:Delta7-sterol 5-desaturase